MIETTLLKYLRESTGYPVYTEIPDGALPDEFILIERTSVKDADGRFLLSGMFAVQSYAASLYKAAVLDEKVYEAMRNMPDSCGDVTRVELNNSYNFTDPTTESYRYQSIYEITFYGG